MVQGVHASVPYILLAAHAECWVLQTEDDTDKMAQPGDLHTGDLPALDPIWFKDPAFALGSVSMTQSAPKFSHLPCSLLFSCICS